MKFTPLPLDPKTHKVLKAKHSSQTVEHYTPIEIVEAARHTLGSIDLDPASTARANMIVKAERFYTKKDDGLSMTWHRGTVFLNPPGSKDSDQRSNQVVWWEKLVTSYLAGQTTAAIFVSFSVEFLQTSQGARLGHLAAPGASVYPLDFSFCIPKTRIQYVHPVLMRRQKAPPHASAIFHLPDREDPRAVHRFHEAFSPIGHVVT